MLTLNVDGYRQAKRILDDLPNNMQKRILLTALRKSASPMLKAVRNKVPVKSGKLRKTIRIVRYRDRNAPKEEVAIALKPVFEKTKKKGTVNQFYGKFVHDGTSDPRVSPKGKFLVFENQEGRKIFTKGVKGMKPSPFLEAGFKESQERTVALFGSELASAVGNYVTRNFKPSK